MNIHDCPECGKKYEGEIMDEMECDGEGCGYKNTCHDCGEDSVWGYICECDI